MGLKKNNAANTRQNPYQYFMTVELRFQSRQMGETEVKMPLIINRKDLECVNLK